MLQAHLRGEHLPFSAAELDEVVSRTAGASRELGLVEREVTAYWTAEFFRQQRERDPDQTWTALLLQWIRVVRQWKQRAGLWSATWAMLLIAVFGAREL